MATQDPNPDTDIGKAVLLAELRKLNAENERTLSERDNYDARTIKTHTEARWYPLVLIISALGAGSALTLVIQWLSKTAGITQ